MDPFKNIRPYTDAEVAEGEEGAEGAEAAAADGDKPATEGDKKEGDEKKFQKNILQFKK